MLDGKDLKPAFALVVAAVLAVGVSACGGDGNSTATSPSTSAQTTPGDGSATATSESKNGKAAQKELIEADVGSLRTEGERAFIIYPRCQRHRLRNGDGKRRRCLEGGGSLRRADFLAAPAQMQRKTDV
jgi:hypothetical protein